jgi:hypothetical protein
MALTIKTTLTITPPDTMERTAERLRDRRGFMREVGQYMVGTGTRRVPKGRGDLARSIREVEASADHVVVGSNLPYAAIRQEGGTIVPRTVKALAIPVLDVLRKRQLWPRDLDPTREILQFVPFKGKGTVFGALVNPDVPLTGKQRKKRGALPGYPTGVLYVLARSVRQEGKPYLFFDEKDVEEIERLWRKWLERGT